jgi:hypothetical protein
MAFKKGSIHLADADDMAILPEPAKLGNGAPRGDLLAD